MNEPAAEIQTEPARNPNAPTTEEIAAVKALTEKNRAIDSDPDANAPVPETPKTAHELEIEQLRREAKRMQRGIDRKTRQLAEERARNSTREPVQQNNRASADDSEPVSLTRAQIRELVAAEAARLAPTLASQEDESKRRTGVVEVLAKTWGKERFDELASDLDEAFGGLADRAGKPKPATEAVFEADEPAKVIEWLADPENLDEAERISRLNAVQAGKAIAKLEATLNAESAKAKPRASQVPAPLELVRGTGAGNQKRLADLDGDAFNKRRREQIAQRR